MNGDEGAAMAQCFYSLYYLLHGAVNMKEDIVNMLKKQRISFLCVLNAERLNFISETFKTNPTGHLYTWVKNMRLDSDCSSASKGVNLKYNFAPDKLANACLDSYGGPSSKSEPEITALFSYLANPSSLVQSVVLLNK